MKLKDKLRNKLRQWLFGDELAKEEYKVLIDSTEFQKKVLDYIGFGEVDKMIKASVFADKPEYKSAIIYGMSISAMLTSRCKPICVIMKDDKNNPEE